METGLKKEFQIYLKKFSYMEYEWDHHSERVPYGFIYTLPKNYGSCSGSEEDVSIWTFIINKIIDDLEDIERYSPLSHIEAEYRHSFNRSRLDEIRKEYKNIEITLKKYLSASDVFVSMEPYSSMSSDKFYSWINTAYMKISKFYYPMFSGIVSMYSEEDFGISDIFETIHIPKRVLERHYFPILSHEILYMLSIKVGYYLDVYPPAPPECSFIEKFLKYFHLKRCPSEEAVAKYNQKRHAADILFCYNKINIIKDIFSFSFGDGEKIHAVAYYGGLFAEKERKNVLSEEEKWILNEKYIDVLSLFVSGPGYAYSMLDYARVFKDSLTKYEERVSHMYFILSNIYGEDWASDFKRYAMSEGVPINREIPYSSLWKEVIEKTKKKIENIDGSRFPINFYFLNCDNLDLKGYKEISNELLNGHVLNNYSIHTYITSFEIIKKDLKEKAFAPLLYTIINN